ncbi:hypothetical protein JYT44_03060 [Caldithrix abyssi]|nr:hypothetical protein [Caldithrix abyssi]
MPYDTPLILFPLVGGYYFLAKSIFYRHYYRRVSSQKLIFDSIIAGIILFFITFIIRKFVSYWDGLFELVWSIIQLFPYHTNLLGTLIFSFVFAVLFTYLINKLYDQNTFVRKKFKLQIDAITQLGDELENLFVESMMLSELIQVTLKNNKVYVGYVRDISGPQETNYVGIYPILSGYRKSITKKLQFNTPYRKVLETLDDEDGNSILNELKVVIKQDEILTATIFYPEIYDKFQQNME